jgi:hypothetical protein
MPLRKETDKVDLVGLTAVDCLEVIIAVYRVESIVIGELLLRDSFLGLQAKDGIDVLLLLDIREGSPSIALVSMLEHTRCETLLYAYHSFLTMGFSQRELRFGAGGPRGPGGAGGAGGPAGARLWGAPKAMVAEARKPAVMEAERIIETMRYSREKAVCRFEWSSKSETTARQELKTPFFSIRISPQRLEANTEDWTYVFSGHVGRWIVQGPPLSSWLSNVGRLKTGLGSCYCSAGGAGAFVKTETEI